MNQEVSNLKMNGYLIENVMNENLYELVDKEVTWAEGITHLSGSLPRLIALQGTVTKENGIPLYRHPMDQEIPVLPFTNTIDKIRKTLEKKLNCTLNHAIIQKYRDGKDHITEHSDKTIDISRDPSNSFIVNYSLGETRLMKFRSKKQLGPRLYEKHNFTLINDSAFVLDLDTNRYFRHRIDRDSRIKLPRISITFRNIVTFYNQENGVFGQGAPKENFKGMDTTEMIKSWSLENKTDTDWNTMYSKGYEKTNTVRL